MIMRTPAKALRGIAAAAAIVATFASTATARQQDGLGVGVIVGEPTGISLKKWTDETHAVDAGLAFSLADDDSFQLHADYLFHQTESSLNPPELKGSAPWYYGIGGRLLFNDNDTHFGIRVPVGIDYLFAESPLDFFAEVAPVLDIAPDVELDLNAAIGLRYFFQ
jgi:hypothetical protein